jgi:hypothetical protein
MATPYGGGDGDSVFHEWPFAVAVVRIPFKRWCCIGKLKSIINVETDVVEFLYR